MTRAYFLLILDLICKQAVTVSLCSHHRLFINSWNDFLVGTTWLHPWATDVDDLQVLQGLVSPQRNMMTLLFALGLVLYHEVRYETRMRFWVLTAVYGLLGCDAAWSGYIGSNVSEEPASFTLRVNERLMPTYLIKWVPGSFPHSKARRSWSWPYAYL
jgi:hypothetical protein